MEYQISDVLVDAYTIAARSLIGKDVFFAPNAKTLLEKANSGALNAVGTLEECNDTAFPFLVRTRQGSLVRTSFVAAKK